IAPAHDRASIRTFDNASTRTGRIELLGLLACSVVLVFGLALTYAARTGRPTESGGQPPATVNLQGLGGPEDLVPLLTTFADVRAAAAWFFVAFWIAHVVRRWRRADDDPLVLPVLLLLCGLGLMTMLALRDPLRDTTTASTFVSGVVIGLVLLVSASEMDFE